MVRRQTWFLSAALSVGVLLPTAASAQKLVIVVRHAERADAGSGTPTMAADPSLSSEGQARAARLAAMLADAGISAIFATEYKRTQETAKPLATKLGLSVQTTASGDPGALVAKLKGAHASDVVLVVGHSNTVPDVLKAFGGPAVTIADNEYDNLFIIVPATGAMTRIRF